MFAGIGVASETMFGREDGYNVELVLQQNVQQVFVAYHASVVGEDGYPLSFQQWEVFGSLFVASDDSFICLCKGLQGEDTQEKDGYNQFFHMYMLNRYGQRYDIF